MRYLKWGLPLACLLAMSSANTLAAGDAKAGAIKAQPCMGCHGIEGYANAYPTYRVPRLGGQRADYLVKALEAYKKSNRHHKTMQAQAGSLSEQDMQDIAAYFAAFGSK